MKNKITFAGLGIILIMLIALVTRFWQLDRIPANLNPDEGDTLRTFLEHDIGKNRPWLQPNWNGAPSFNLLLIGYVWKLSGFTYEGTRLAMASLSLVAIALFYGLIVKKTQNIGLALIGSFLLIGDAWYLHFSRSAWENALVAIPVLLLLISDELSLNKRRVCLVLAATLSMYGYHPAKFVALAAGLSLIVSLIREKKLVFKQFLLWALISLLALPAIYATFFQFRTESLHRIQNVSVFSYPTAREEIWTNTINSLKAFSLWRRADFNFGLHDRYLVKGDFVLAPWLVVFYWTGLIWLLMKKRHQLGWFLILLLPTQILSQGTPDAARAVHLVVFVYYIVAIGMWRLVLLFEGRRWRRLIVLFLIGAASATSIITFLSYFSWIENPITLEHRQPYVKREEYQDWLSSQRLEIQESKRSLSGGEWRALKD